MISKIYMSSTGPSRFWGKNSGFLQKLIYHDWWHYFWDCWCLWLKQLYLYSKIKWKVQKYFIFHKLHKWYHKVDISWKTNHTKFTQFLINIPLYSWINIQWNVSTTWAELILWVVARYNTMIYPLKLKKID